jgi:alpha-L-fucosidase
MNHPIRQDNWHKNAFFGIHYDLHANKDDTELGRELTAEHLRERLEMVRPDWIQCDCKGHDGYTSWPTKVGSTSPGVVNDALRIHRDVTRKLGIRLGVHYSGVWDFRAIELHPEWAKVGPTGERDKNATCRLSGYTDELMIPQMIEILENYDVDGFWVDGDNWGAQPCWCDRCKAEFTRRTGLTDIPNDKEHKNWQTWLKFHRDLFVEYVDHYAKAVHAKKPSCLVCSNWMYTIRQPDEIRAEIDYISGDYDPSWGAYRAAIEGRAIDSRNMPWDLMAWGFCKTGDINSSPPWAMKSTLHLSQEVAEVVALGGGIMIYNNPQRSGWLTGWQQQIIADVAAFCRERQEVCFQSKTIPQAAVLHLADHFYANNDPLFNLGQAVQPVEGALHALLETHHSADILPDAVIFDRMDDYKLLVVPEQTRLTKTLIDRLETFAKNGGHVLLSGEQLVNETPELAGVKSQSQTLTKIFLPVGNEAVPVSGSWQKVELTTGTQPLVYALTQQEPEKDRSDKIIVTRRPIGKGSIVAIHGPIFRDYFLGHYPRLRKFLGRIFDSFDIPWLATLTASPRLEMILREKNGKTLVNLINRGAGETLYPQRNMIDEIPPVVDVTVKIRQPTKPKSVSIVPQNTKMEWSYADGFITVQLPRVDIHCVLIVE